MKVSKTNFIKYLKYDSYILEKNKPKFGIITEEEETEHILMEEENNRKIKDFTYSIAKSDDVEDEEIDQHLMTMLPYYNFLEIQVGDFIRDRFGGNVIYSGDTFKQKSFTYHKGGLDFFCYIDGYQEDEDTIRIFETKATTSSNFSKRNDNFYFATPIEGSRKKERNEFFIPDKNGIYYPYDQIHDELPEGNDYEKRKQRLFDKFDGRGKYIYDLAYQYFVINNSLKTNKKVEYYLVLLNHEYKYDGKVDEFGNPAYSEDLIRFYNMTSIVEEMDSILEDDSDVLLERYEKGDMSDTVLKEYLSGRTVNQELLKELFKDKLPEENSVFDYIGRHFGFTDENGKKVNLNEILFDYNYYSALDIPEEWLTRRGNIIQREAIKNGEPFINKDKIEAGIKELKYPIYHLDFETFNSPLPRFKGEKPYTQSLFQFSIHIEREPGVCDFDEDNISFLAADHEDHRKELVETLLKTIKDDGGSVLVYNESFEKGRLEELQEYFPEYYDEIQNIIDRLFDLLDLVRGNKKLYERLGFDKDVASEYNYYHKDLGGSFSIKKVLPVFSDLSYEGMGVADGVDAMVTYANYPNMTEEEHHKKYNELIEYCKQDTWAMFVILDELRKLI